MENLLNRLICTVEIGRILFLASSLLLAFTQFFILFFLGRQFTSLCNLLQQCLEESSFGFRVEQFCCMHWWDNCCNGKKIRLQKCVLPNTTRPWWVITNPLFRKLFGIFLTIFPLIRYSVPVLCAKESFTVWSHGESFLFKNNFNFHMMFLTWSFIFGI